MRLWDILKVGVVLGWRGVGILSLRARRSGVYSERTYVPIVPSLAVLNLSNIEGSVNAGVA